MADYQDLLEEQVNGAADKEYLSTKAQIVDYYEATYGANWRSQFTTDYSSLTGQSRNTVSRQVQGGRENTAPRRADVKANYTALGKQLPPTLKPPKNGYTVTMSGTLIISEGSKKKKGAKARARYEKYSFTRTITGAEAQQLTQDPNFDTIFLAYLTSFDSNPVTDFTVDSLTIDPA